MATHFGRNSKNKFAQEKATEGFCRFFYFGVFYSILKNSSCSPDGPWTKAMRIVVFVGTESRGTLFGGVRGFPPRESARSYAASTSSTESARWAYLPHSQYSSPPFEKSSICNVREPVGRLVRSRQNPGRCARLPGESAPHFSCPQVSSILPDNSSMAYYCQSQE